MRKLLSLSLMLVALLGGCKSATPHEDVFVLDISQSIDPNAEQQMLVVVEVAAQHLRRGDTLTIIPITANAQAELQGRTLHYAVPPAEDRKAYDADLRNLNAQIKRDLDRLQTDAVAHPGKHTDIIGSIWVALKAFSERQTDKRLVVLSDFIQDDDRFNFRKDFRLETELGGSALGRTVTAPYGSYSQPYIVLGRLRSSEFSALAPDRQRAIGAFWAQVMSPATVDPDGTAAVLRSATNK